MYLETLLRKCKKDNKEEEEEEREKEREDCLGITRMPLWSFNYKIITRILLSVECNHYKFLIIHVLLT